MAIENLCPSRTNPALIHNLQTGLHFFGQLPNNYRYNPGSTRNLQYLGSIYPYVTNIELNSNPIQSNPSIQQYSLLGGTRREVDTLPQRINHAHVMFFTPASVMGLLQRVLTGHLDIRICTSCTKGRWMHQHDFHMNQIMQDVLKQGNLATAVADNLAINNHLVERMHLILCSSLYHLK